MYIYMCVYVYIHTYVKWMSAGLMPGLSKKWMSTGIMLACASLSKKWMSTGIVLACHKNG